MAHLVRTVDGLLVARRVLFARGFFPRAIGLLGRAGLPEDTTIWLDPCRAVHTWGMRFPIDVVFVDRVLCITSIGIRIAPWHWVHGRNAAHSVFEFSGGASAVGLLAVGDSLAVRT